MGNRPSVLEPRPPLRVETFLPLVAVFRLTPARAQSSETDSVPRSRASMNARRSSTGCVSIQGIGPPMSQPTVTHAPGLVCYRGSRFIHRLRASGSHRPLVVSLSNHERGRVRVEVVGVAFELAFAFDVAPGVAFALEVFMQPSSARPRTCPGRRRCRGHRGGGGASRRHALPALHRGGGGEHPEGRRDEVDPERLESRPRARSRASAPGSCSCRRAAPRR